MSRTYVVTGAASGIGAATVELLRGHGHRVIGTDLRDVEVIADLSTPAGRASLVSQVGELTGGAVDAVIANAGVGRQTVAAAAVNYFGAVATLEGLRPLLAASPAPRAAATLSGALLAAFDPPLLDTMLGGDEAGALATAAELENAPDRDVIYGTAKRALARWIRRQAPTSEWAGQGITLNAVAPGFVDTPMVAGLLRQEGMRESATRMMPLRGIATSRELAEPLVWLCSAENAQMTGQVLFVDGGMEVMHRGDLIWDHDVVTA